MKKTFTHKCYFCHQFWGEYSENGKFSYKVCPDCIANGESYLDAKITYQMLKMRKEEK